jgi:hypothetical protein
MRDPRPDNFKEAYAKMGYSSGDAEMLGNQRAQEDRDALFIVEGCSDFKTAQVTVWLLEAAQALCAGDHGKNEAVRLVEMAKSGLTK